MSELDNLQNLPFKELLKCGSPNDPDNPSQKWRPALKFKGFQVMESVKNEDKFKIVKDDFTCKINCYECKTYYNKDKYIIFSGWDYDVWFDTETRKKEEIYTR
jgi:hypothetical protein